MDATRVSRTQTPLTLLSDRRHYELLVKFSRIVVWNERELGTQDPWHGPILDPTTPQSLLDMLKHKQRTTCE